MKRSEVDRNQLSPMMKQYMDIKDQYEDAILFYRLGDFYEMFFDDAITASHELELALTGKQAGLSERVPMCGVPHHAYQMYLDKLIDKGYKVAIAEQLTDPKETQGMVERDVIQVVTKGTRLDAVLNERDNNYVGNIYDFEYCYGVAYTDISTGQFYTLLVDYDDSKLMNEIVCRDIKEVIVNSKINRGLVKNLRDTYHILVSIEDALYEQEDYAFLWNTLTDVRLVTTVRHLLAYLIDTKKGDLTHLQPVELVDQKKHLRFDVHTKKNLELTETIRLHERMYSLLWLLDKTKTAMGSRYLRRNIENPLTDRKAIERRYDIIENLLNQFILKGELTEELSNVYDLERLASRIGYGNLNARDLIQLKNSLSHLPRIHAILSELHYDKNIDVLDDLYQLLEKSINEDAPMSLKEGSLIKSVSIKNSILYVRFEVVVKILFFKSSKMKKIVPELKI